MKRKFLSITLCIFLVSCTQTGQTGTNPSTATPGKPVHSATPQASSTLQPTEGIPTAIPEPFKPKYTFELVNEIGRGIIKNMAVSPDGKVLAVASSTGVWIYRMFDGELLQSRNGDPTITIPHSDVADIVWSPDGKYLAVTQDRNGIWIWDAVTWELLTEITPTNFTEKTHDTPGFAWSPDSKQLALGKGQGAVWVWTAGENTWQALENKIPKQYGQYGVLWTKDGELQTVMGWEIYDVYSGELIGPYPHWIDGYGRLIWSPNQEFVYFLFDLGGGVIDISTGENVIGCCTQFSWSGDGDKIALFSGYGLTIYTANVKQQQIIDEYPKTDKVFAITWTPTGDLLAAVYKEGKTTLINITKEKDLMDFSLHNYFNINDGMDEPLIYSVYQRNTVWNVEEDIPERTYESWTNHCASTSSYKFDQEIIDRKLKISIDNRMNDVYILDINHPELFESADSRSTHFATNMNRLAFPDDKNRLLTSNMNGDIFLWDIPSGNLLGYVNAHQEVLEKLVWKRKLLYTNSTDGTVKIWKIVPVKNETP